MSGAGAAAVGADDVKVAVSTPLVDSEGEGGGEAGSEVAPRSSRGASGSSSHSHGGHVKARVKIAHGGHVGVLLDDGTFVCEVEEPGMGRDGALAPTSVKHADCRLDEADLTAAERLAAGLHDHGEDGHHMHGPGCGHALVPHGDHTDFLVGDELHHQGEEECEIHGRVRLLANTEASVGSFDTHDHRSVTTFSRSKFAVFAHTAVDGVLRRNNRMRATLAARSESEADLMDVVEEGRAAAEAAAAATRAPAAGTAKKPRKACCGGADARRFILMSFLTGGFFFVELIYGIAIGSLALQADAFHMASDLIALFVGFYSLVAAQRQSTVFATYGWTRMEIVGALMNGVFLLATCFNITLEALHRMQDISEVSEALSGNGEDLTLVAVIGLAVNILGLFIFGHGHGGGDGEGGGGGHGHSHGGGHGHSHGGGDGMNANIKGVLLHVLGDALGSVGVIISGLIVTYGESWGENRFYADPLVSLVIVAIIAFGTVPLVKRCVATLLQHTPPGVDMHVLRKDILSVEGVLDVHELHVWELNNNVLVASAHVTCSHGINWMAASDDMKLSLHKHGVHNTTLQPEYVNPVEFTKLGPGYELCHEPICDDPTCVQSACCDIKAMPAANVMHTPTGDSGHGHSHGDGHGHSHGGHARSIDTTDSPIPISPEREHKSRGGHSHSHGGHGHSHSHGAH